MKLFWDIFTHPQNMMYHRFLKSDQVIVNSDKEIDADFGNLQINLGRLAALILMNGAPDFIVLYFLRKKILFLIHHYKSHSWQALSQKWPAPSLLHRTE